MLTRVMVIYDHIFLDHNEKALICFVFVNLRGVLNLSSALDFIFVNTKPAIQEAVFYPFENYPLIFQKLKKKY